MMPVGYLMKCNHRTLLIVSSSVLSIMREFVGFLLVFLNLSSYLFLLALPFHGWFINDFVNARRYHKK